MGAAGSSHSLRAFRSGDEASSLRDEVLDGARGALGVHGARSVRDVPVHDAEDMIRCDAFHGEAHGVPCDVVQCAHGVHGAPDAPGAHDVLDSDAGVLHGDIRDASFRAHDAWQNDHSSRPAGRVSLEAGGVAGEPWDRTSMD